MCSSVVFLIFVWLATPWGVGVRGGVCGAKNFWLPNVFCAKIVPADLLLAHSEGREGLTDTMSDTANNDKMGVLAIFF